MSEKEKKVYTKRNAYEKAFKDEITVLKQEFSQALSQMSKQINTYSENIAIAKSLSIIGMRVVSDIASGKEIKLMDTEWGKTVDRTYYLKQLNATEDMDTFLLGKTASEEELDQVAEEHKANYYKTMAASWIGTILMIGGEDGLEKAAADGKLVEYAKIQSVGDDWDEEMADHIEEAYRTSIDGLNGYRKEELRKAIASLLMQEGVGYKSTDDFPVHVRTRCKKALQRKEHVWREEIMEWLSSTVSEVEEAMAKRGEMLVEKTKELVSRWKGLDHHAELVSNHVANQEYREALTCYSNLSDKVAQLTQRENLAGATI